MTGIRISGTYLEIIQCFRSEPVKECGTRAHDGPRLKGSTRRVFHAIWMV